MYQEEKVSSAFATNPSRTKAGRKDLRDSAANTTDLSPRPWISPLSAQCALSATDFGREKNRMSSLYVMSLIAALGDRRPGQSICIPSGQNEMIYNRGHRRPRSVRQFKRATF